MPRIAALVLLFFFAAATGAQETRTCAAGVTAVLAEDVTKKFNLARACTLYADLIAQHIPKVAVRPGAVFYVVRNLQKVCDREADLASSLGRPARLVSCLRRTPRATEIWLAEDRPENYVIALVDGLDYANQLYLPRETVVREASEAVTELKYPELRLKFHATVDAKDLKK